MYVHSVRSYIYIYIFECYLYCFEVHICCKCRNEYNVAFKLAMLILSPWHAFLDVSFSDVMHFCRVMGNCVCCLCKLDWPNDNEIVMHYYLLMFH